MAKNFDLKPEDKLILNCSATKISDDEKKNINNLIDTDLDWDYLLKTATRHRLNYLLHWQLEKLCPEKVPDDVKDKLQGDFHNNVHRNLAMFRELIRIIDLLQQQGVEPIPYKGPVLAIMTYENLGFRRFADLDFYVPLEDVPLTRDILVENGYEHLMELTTNQEEAFHKFQREYHFTSKSTGITLEIKWKFLSSLYSIGNEALFRGADFITKVNLDQFKVKTVTTEPLILILAIHNASHSFSSLYRFCDLSELIKNEESINWPLLMETATQLGVAKIFMVNLYILRELFKIELPGDVQEQFDEDVEKISGDIIRRLFNEKNRGTLEKVSFHMHLREKRVDKLKVLLVMIFLPTPGVIESVSLPRILEPIYYILRVFQMLKNVITHEQ
ncbi:MAG: hypothetical protein BWX95_02522 [Bacteroidetes bacterium ADurb.Bin141]|nr:MAG: hypothetical protein BWX95_02522 [Bacteroidetes bacterium ADurb.Bin141]